MSNNRKGAERRITSNKMRPKRKDNKEVCRNCSKDLSGAERALFVEEEVGRIFCSESCIAGYFSPEIKRLEKEYLRKLSPRDLRGEEREHLSHLRWTTLQKPDEVWREKTLAGDHRFTLISKFVPKNEKPVWCVCICLFLRGEPSFLYLAFPTRNAAMTNHYRKGERVEISRSVTTNEGQDLIDTIDDSEEPSTLPKGDRLAGEWTEEESLQAQLKLPRNPEDIPEEEFDSYQSCFDETLESPDEVWSLDLRGEKGDFRIYHFMRSYRQQDPTFWYIVVARETDQEKEIEILDCFPTRDETLVERYRNGKQEIGVSGTQTQRRVLH